MHMCVQARSQYIPYHTWQIYTAKQFTQLPSHTHNILTVQKTAPASTSTHRLYICLVRCWGHLRHFEVIVEPKCHEGHGVADTLQRRHDLLQEDKRENNEPGIARRAQHLEGDRGCHLNHQEGGELNTCGSGCDQRKRLVLDRMGLMQRTCTKRKTCQQHNTWSNKQLPDRPHKTSIKGCNT